MKKFNKIFICLLLTISAVHAESFVDHFSGKKARCHISKITDALLENIPEPFASSIDFHLTTIDLKFDDPEVQNFYRRTLGQDPSTLFIVTYEIKTKKANISSNFVLKRSAIVESDRSRDVAVTASEPQKTSKIIFHDGFVADKYEFIKNGRQMFTCSSLDIF